MDATELRDWMVKEHDTFTDRRVEIKVKEYIMSL